MTMKKLDLTALSAACLLALSTGAIAGMTKAEHNAAAESIAATYAPTSPLQVDERQRMDVCMQEARARQGRHGGTRGGRSTFRQASP